MYSTLKLAKDEPPVASVYLNRDRLHQALRPILSTNASSASLEPELVRRQNQDGTWTAEELDACGCLKHAALTGLLVACGVNRFHPQVLADLQTGFATLIAFLRLLMTGGFGQSKVGMMQLRDRLSKPAHESAERAFYWLVKFGLGYPEMPVRLGLAPGVDEFCAALIELLVELENSSGGAK